ncbi:MAG: hypothetical protein M3Q79_02330 [bacterium]|nr:hypothetical protein [bacterium]
MINLLPPATKSERRFGRLNKVLVAASAAIMLLAVVCGVIILFSFQQLNNEEKRVNSEISSNNNEIKSLETAQQQIDQTAKQLDTIKKLQQDEVQFSEIVPQIGSIIPPGAILTSLSLTGKKDQPLQLSFKLKSQELASIVRINLVNSPIFSSADILNVTNETSDAATPTTTYEYSTSIAVSFEGQEKKPASSAGGATQ